MKNEIDILKFTHEFERRTDTAWTEDRQYRTNHTGCPAGEDTRERLYIKCVSPVGSYIGHCFNCGTSGAYFSKGVIRRFTELEEIERVETLPSAGTMPDIFTKGPITDFRIKAWLYRHNLLEEDWKVLKLAEDRGKLIIPVSGRSVQIRDFNGFVGGGKYVSYFDKEDKNRYFVHINVDKSKGNQFYPVVITEDVLSAYRCSRATGFTSMAALGTNITTQVSNSTFFYPKDRVLLIWFDGDKAGRAASVREHAKLSGIKNPYIVLADKSPKEYGTDQELKDALKKGTEHIHPPITIE